MNVINNVFVELGYASLFCGLEAVSLDIDTQRCSGGILGILKVPYYALFTLQMLRQVRLYVLLLAPLFKKYALEDTILDTSPL